MSTRAVSFRFAEQTLLRLDRLSRQTRQSRSRVVSDLVEEGLRMEQHPGVVFRSGPSGRRPGLVGGPDVWEIITVFRELPGEIDDAIARTAKLGELSEGQVRSAVHYYGEYRQEIDDWIEDNQAQADRAERIWRTQRPSNR